MFHCYVRGTGYYVYASFTTVSYQVSFTTVSPLNGDVNLFSIWCRVSNIGRYITCPVVILQDFNTLVLQHFYSLVGHSCKSHSPCHIPEEPLKAFIFRDIRIISDNPVCPDKIHKKFSKECRCIALDIQSHKDIVFQPTEINFP